MLDEFEIISPLNEIDHFSLPVVKLQHGGLSYLYLLFFFNSERSVMLMQRQVFLFLRGPD